MTEFKKRNGLLVNKARRSYMVLGALRYMFHNGETTTTELALCSTLVNGKLLKNTKYSCSNRRLGALLGKDSRVICAGYDRMTQTSVWDLSEEGRQWCITQEGQ